MILPRSFRERPGIENCIIYSIGERYHIGTGRDGIVYRLMRVSTQSIQTLNFLGLSAVFYGNVFSAFSRAYAVDDGGGCKTPRELNSVSRDDRDTTTPTFYHFLSSVRRNVYTYTSNVVLENGKTHIIHS